MTEYQKWIDERGAGDHTAMLLLRDILETAFNAGMTRSAEICRDHGNKCVSTEGDMAEVLADAIINARDGNDAA